MPIVKYPTRLKSKDQTGYRYRSGLKTFQP